MAERVLIHIGQPKTGTTYLQTIAWAHRELLEERDRVRLPADRADHLWASLAVREDPRLASRSERAPGAYDRVLRGIEEWDGTAVVTHEFFGAATAEQAARFVDRIAADRVEVLVTAREPVGLTAAAWQESLKRGRTTPLRAFATEPSDDPTDVWSLRSIDLADVLDRWAPAVPEGHTHVLVLPRRRGAPDELWHRFAALVGIGADDIDVDVARGNPSMALADVEFLRRFHPYNNPRMDSLTARNRWVRRYLTEGHLAGRPGDRVGLHPDQVAAARERGRRALAALERHAVRVDGDPGDLLVPDDLPPQRTPDDVTPEELVDAGLRTVLAVAADLAGTRAADPGATGR